MTLVPRFGGYPRDADASDGESLKPVLQPNDPVFTISPDHTEIFLHCEAVPVVRRKCAVFTQALRVADWLANKRVTSRFQRVTADCAAKDKWESGYVMGIPAGHGRRGEEGMGVRACPAPLSDEYYKTVLSLIKAQLVPLAFSLLITGRCEGTWLGELQLQKASIRRPRPSA
ncbi:hypothetical protein PoB_006421000 [Plakobranchus ocellatus]|uniref:Uncharacterized protein n=1 Tax=Plakobranchus ocellatus TaxID=259542 RepID=A0AAV4D0Q2_9GAST|nr:hypothetical protein PoB_006421000 [Plakobranchus ocellatus]